MYVYFIQSCDAVGLIKIGMAANPKKRLEALQTGSSHPLKIIGTVQFLSAGEAREAEQQAHRLFRYCRKGGEWFTPNKPLRDFIAATSTSMTWYAAAREAFKATKNKMRRHTITCNRLRAAS